MLLTYLYTIIGMVALVIIWVVIQNAWRNFFPEYTYFEEDVLAGRGSCQGCNCKLICKNKFPGFRNNETTENTE